MSVVPLNMSTVPVYRHREKLVHRHSTSTNGTSVKYDTFLPIWRQRMSSVGNRRPPPLGNLIEQKRQHKIPHPPSPALYYLDQATASISVCALLYNSSLFARPVRRSMMAGSSFNNDDKRLVSILPKSVKKWSSRLLFASRT